MANCVHGNEGTHLQPMGRWFMSDKEDKGVLAGLEQPDCLLVGHFTHVCLVDLEDAIS